MKNVACYCRVSTEEQVKFGFSIQAQKDSLEKYCKENKYKYEFFVDEGISASSMKRPALQKILSNINNYDMLLFTKLDRLSRNVLDANNINKILNDNKVVMKAIDEDDIDTSTADGTFIFNLKVSLAQREIEKTSERIKFVFANKREKGEVTSGSSKFGYNIENKHYIINKDEAHRIIEFYKYYVDIAGDTNKSFVYYKSNFKSKSYDSYIKILTDKAYIGLYKLYKKDRYLKEYIPRIMSDELFNSVQLLLSKKRRIPKNNIEIPTTLFDGILRCKICGSKMSRKVAYRGNVTYISYMCWRSSKLSQEDSKTHQCINKTTMSEIKIEKYLINNIKNEINKYIINNTISSETVIKKPQKDNSILIKKKLDKLKELYLEDIIDKDVYKNDYFKLTQDLQKNKEQQEFIPKQKDFSKLRQILNSDFESIYKTLSREEKRKFWINVVDDIYYEKSEIKGIKFN